MLVMWFNVCFIQYFDPMWVLELNARLVCIHAAEGIFHMQLTLIATHSDHVGCGKGDLFTIFFVRPHNWSDFFHWFVGVA